MNATLPHGRIAFLIDRNDMLSRDSEGNPFCTLLMEATLDDGRHWRARIPDNPIKPMFDAVRKLVDGDSRMSLGLDTPQVDLCLRFDPENRVLVTVHPVPISLGTVRLGTRSGSEQQIRDVDTLSAIADIAGETGDLRDLLQTDLRKFLGGIMFTDSTGSVLRANIMLDVTDLHFWTKPRDLLTAMLALLEDVASDRLEPGTGTPTLVRDSEICLGPLRKITDRSK